MRKRTWPQRHPPSQGKLSTFIVRSSVGPTGPGAARKGKDPRDADSIPKSGCVGPWNGSDFVSSNVPRCSDCSPWTDDDSEIGIANRKIAGTNCRELSPARQGGPVSCHPTKPDRLRQRPK